jgi:hypothetical protein
MNEVSCLNKHYERPSQSAASHTDQERLVDNRAFGIKGTRDNRPDHVGKFSEVRDRIPNHLSLAFLLILQEKLPEYVVTNE